MLDKLGPPAITTYVLSAARHFRTVPVFGVMVVKYRFPRLSVAICLIPLMKSLGLRPEFVVNQEAIVFVATVNLLTCWVFAVTLSMLYTIVPSEDESSLLLWGVGAPDVRPLVITVFTMRGDVASKLEGKIVTVVAWIVAEVVEPPLLVAVMRMVYETPDDRPLNTAGLVCVVGRTPADGVMLYVYVVAPTPPVQPTVIELVVVAVTVRAGCEGGSITEKLGPSVEPDRLTELTIIVWGPGVIDVNTAILLSCELHMTAVPSSVYLNDVAN